MTGDWTFLAVVALIFIGMTVVPSIIQRRRHDQEVASVRRGDWVVTVGGIIGQVQAIDQQEAILQTGATSEMTIIRQAIRGRIANRPSFVPDVADEAEGDQGPEGTA